MTTQRSIREDEWKKNLTPEQYRVLRAKGTEGAFTGAYWNEHSDGTYHCAGCGAALFSSTTKFDSGTGWPSFSDPMVLAPSATPDLAENRPASAATASAELGVSPNTPRSASPVSLDAESVSAQKRVTEGAQDAIELVPDTSHGMTRTEVRCKKCGGHLGHVFDDGPTPSGKRFCINSCALKMEKKN